MVDGIKPPLPPGVQAAGRTPTKPADEAKAQQVAEAAQAQSGQQAGAAPTFSGAAVVNTAAVARSVSTPSSGSSSEAKRRDDTLKDIEGEMREASMVDEHDVRAMVDFLKRSSGFSRLAEVHSGLNWDRAKSLLSEA